MMTNTILFICGSLNQTTQMHQISEQMTESNCFFAPYYADGLERLAGNMGLLNPSVLGGQHRSNTLNYFKTHDLQVDERGEDRCYDLVFTCSDLIIQKNIRGKRIVLVQEGITEPEGVIYRLQRMFPILPRYLANTATTGLSDAYDVFCVASQGYADLFARKKVRPEKIAVTGIPNFDNLQKHRNNSFPFHNYVLVATTPHRESFRFDNRIAFLRHVAEIAAGRPIIFKLHPIENFTRAKREIRRLFPDALVFKRGNVNDMIANADVVITQRSSCTFVAVALGKEIHTDLDLEELKKLLPIQNNGTSSHNIAVVAHHLLHTPMETLRLVRKGYSARPRWEQA
jgi:hypothetical protein